MCVCVEGWQIEIKGEEKKKGGGGIYVCARYKLVQKE